MVYAVLGGPIETLILRLQKLDEQPGSAFDVLAGYNCPLSQARLALGPFIDEPAACPEMVPIIAHHKATDSASEGQVDDYNRDRRETTTGTRQGT